mgnify:FL=1
MPPPVKADPEKVAQVILGESVGDGPRGMEFVASVLATRAKRRGTTLEQEALRSALNERGVRVYQFTAAGRPDLAEFAQAQPQLLQDAARLIAQDAMQPTYVPSYPNIEHYVTKGLFRQRDTLPSTHWLHKMDAVGTIGSHVALQQKSRPGRK